ncbi:NADH ubiquinone oxidoreductase sgdh subunit [Trichuris trichiura]|uniref:NADH dehydrogenase [ubiquinone] 1 beta subcomplex subunit 5, mitochondrial n=1 Tax=Trichuris trichiura TaxID=36087 RepID=A0A077ZBS1_TRITR|nr:NADH ubiquinone oxidoreductase sgdh subunit [Trichuris trichiura]
MYNISKASRPLLLALDVARDAIRSSHDRKLMIRPVDRSLSFFLTTAKSVLLAKKLISGKCELKDTPEGYEPHYWEYEKHPISRFIMRYLTLNPQKFYEKKLARLDLEMQQRRWINEEKRVKHLMFERADYKAWYYIPMKAKWVERNRWYFDYLRENFETYKHL